MKLSIICYLSDDKKLNQTTVEALEKMASYSLEHDNQVTVAGKHVDKKYNNGKKDSVTASYEVEVILNTDRVQDDRSWYENVITRIGNHAFTSKVNKETYVSEQDAHQKMAEKASGDYIMIINAGDDISSNLAEVFVKGNVHCYDMDTYMITKAFHDETFGAFRNYKKVTDGEDIKSFYIIDLKSKYDCFPFGFGGVIIRAEAFKKQSVDPALGLEAERDFMLRLMAKAMKTCFLPYATLTAYEYEEHDNTFYRGLYMREWYFESVTDFWMPFLQEMKETYGSIPVFIQYNFMYSIMARFNGNMDNKNKHVIEEGHGEEYLELIGQAFRLIEENIMLNRNKVKDCITGDTMKWVYGILRNGKDYKFERFFLAGKIYYGIGDTLFNSLMSLSTNILFINYRDGKLEIDGTVHPILYSMVDEVYFRYDNKKYKIQYNERYGLTKAFGAAICKRHSFHLSIPVKDKSESELFCEAAIGSQLEPINIRYPSHFSRVCNAFGSSHWVFGDNREYMMTAERKGIIIRKVNKRQKFIKELKLLKDMLMKNNYTRKYALLRVLYFICRPFMTGKPIWMYIDKIYKGGDSSEYLYKYASAQNKKIKHYYLVDKKSTDYKRLKKEGYKPLVRDSLKHRLVFLYADMMVISNSTVYAFNGYTLTNSSYIRDLTHFHVCCVQHGMSVQKIAIAQNRLRDNTRLYFCASKYEIDNLSRPVYDYVGYDALKLTGVPRYDGLKDRAKKQIMISPTWRMQAAMPVRTSESEQRDYNPLFKESEYFKVFNALINDKRLIDAAEKYGYRIKYVLHPIVSSQVEDFDKNDFVDIVPAVGDMSYEDMFCESSLMVTDFSGIQFDFAYMRKPLVYLHHKDIPQHYEEGTFHYDTMAFGEICMITMS